MFNATCLIKTDIDTVNKCMGQNPYNPETFLQNFASRLTSFDDPLLNIYPTSEIAGNIEDEDVILGLREPQKLIEWAKTMKERTQCMAMAEFSAALWLSPSMLPIRLAWQYRLKGRSKPKKKSQPPLISKKENDSIYES